MADDTVKRLMVALKLSTKEWQAAVRGINSQLKEINDKAKRDASEMKATQKEQIKLTQQQIADQKLLSSQSKAMADFDKAKAAWQAQQQAAIKTKIQQRILETAELKKQSAEQQAQIRLEQQQLQLVSQRIRIQQQQNRIQNAAAKAGGGGGTGGGGGGLGFLAGALGGGPVGMIAAGATIGNVISSSAEHLLDKTIETVHRLGEALMEATGPAAQLREQFEKLSRRAGESPDEYLDKLRVATRGLADDVQIYRVANNFMQSGIKVTTEDMIKMVGATVDLARAQGKDAPTAMNALERALKTGRTQQLAMVTGLSRQELQLKGVSQALDATTRNTLQFNQVLAAMEQRLKEVGTPATTLPELFKQLHNVQKNFVDDLAIAISKSQGYKDAIAALSKLLFDLEPVLGKIVKALAHLTDAFEIITPLAKLFIDTLKIGYEVAASWEKIISTLIRFDTTFTTVFSGGKADKFRQVMAQVALGFRTMAEYADIAAIRVRTAGDVIAAVTQGKFSEASKAYRQMAQDIEDSKKEYLKDALGIAEFGMGKTKEPTAGEHKDVDPNIAGAKQRQKLQLELAKETAQVELDITMEFLKRRMDAIKAAYESGKTTLQQEVEDLKLAYADEHKAKLAQIEADNKAQIENIRKTGSEAHTPKDIIDMQVAVQERKAYDQRLKAETSFNEQLFGLDQQLIKDKEAAYEHHIKRLAELEKQGVQERLQILEKEFAEGAMDADEYMTRRHTLITAQYLSTINEINQRRIKNQQDAQTQEDDLDAARQERDKQNALLDADADKLKLKSEETRYNTIKKTMELELSEQRGLRGTQGQGIETALTEEEIRLTSQHLNQLEQLRDPIKIGTDQWLKYTEQIQQAETTLVQLQTKLLQLKDIGTPMGGIAQAISGALGAVPSLRVRGAGEALGAYAQSAPLISQTTTAFGQAGGALPFLQNLGTGFTDLFKKKTSEVPLLDDKGKPVLDQFGQQMKKIVQIPFAEKLTSFGKNLGSVVSGIQGLIQGVTSGKTGAQGALGGGLSGMQLGAQFGPWGALAGGVGGAVMGGIFGSKEKRLQQDIHRIQSQLQSIVSDLQNGTLSMSQALQELRAERQNAIQTLSQGGDAKKGGKGGKAGITPNQIQSVIAQIDQQIQQVFNEQQQMLKNLHEGLMEVAQPIQFQEYVQSLDTIITKYQQFTSAAQGNAQEVAAANLYLQDSLQQYVQTLSQQLNQAQQQAIQDALTLINLEYQRQQIINQEAQQEYDILSQGVLTRQRTTAMTKGQEIGQLRYQRDMQLEQINEQISLQKYKVDSETKIFGLAQTRIGLEAQLLEAQKGQADYQIAQIQALAQVVASLSGGLASGQTMQTIQQLMAGGTLPTGPSVLYALLQQLGLGQYVPGQATQGPYGTQNWLASVPSVYASAAEYVASQVPDFMNEVMSQNWGYAIREAQPYVSQGTVEGYDMSGFIAWMQHQQGGGGTVGPPGGPGGPGGPGYPGGPGRPGPGGGYYPEWMRSPWPQYAEGGPVQETGPAIVHKGEWVLPTPIVGIMNKLTGSPEKAITSPIASANSSGFRLDVETQLSNMTSDRVNMEMQVVTARTTLLNNEMAHLQMLQDTLDQINSSQARSGASDLEGLLQKTYETRGRYGSAGFRREYL